MIAFFNRLIGKSKDTAPALSEEYIAVLMDSLNATDAYERAMAAKKLGEAREPRAIDDLIRALQVDFAERFVEESQRKGESGAGSTQAYHAMTLLQEVLRAQSELRQSAAFALGQIGAKHPHHREKIRSVLTTALPEQNDYYVQVVIEQALEDLNP